VVDVGSLEAIKKYAAITLDEKNVITHFEEKPANPETTLAGIALYYYPAEVVGLVKTYISTGNNPDQPGRFVQWLYSRMPVLGYKLEGGWYDIGSHETLAEADKIYTELAKAKSA
jgi:glucose-1-phosphate thymidylyltransferase